MLPENVPSVSAGPLPDVQVLEKDAPAKPTRDSRPYLYELDRLRVVTALSVVAVHVTALMAFLDATVPALQAQNAFVTLFHFTRAVFMFVTAFALVYVYHHKPFSWRAFWKRRGIGVLFPYVFWSLIYYLTGPHLTSPLYLVLGFFVVVLQGSASYQLYYILLTIQFYLLFPFFLKGIQAAAKHPWVVLLISFVLEVGTLYAIQNNLQSSLPAGFASFVDQYQNSIVLVYQFYFILGGLVALHLQSVRAFMLRHSRWVIASVVVSFIALELNYFGRLQIAHVSLAAAVAVLQPAMAFYSTAVIFFLYWLAYTRVSRMVQPTGARGQRVWHALSDASFGIYLVHPLFLTALISLVSAYFLSWSPLVVVPIAWALTAAGSVGVSVLMLRIPLISRLVGRARPMPRIPVLQAWRQKFLTFFGSNNQRATGKMEQGKNAAQPASEVPSEQVVGTVSHRLETGESGIGTLARKKMGS